MTEGAGYIHSLGPRIYNLRINDAVLLSFYICGTYTPTPPSATPTPPQIIALFA